MKMKIVRLNSRFFGKKIKKNESTNFNIFDEIKESQFHNVSPE